jgi:hypothetical protein
VLTLIAAGFIGDYSDNDKLSWQQKFADATGVDKSLVMILVAAASVRITVTISMPASMTVDAMQTSLTSTFGTADAASTALGITVESDPTISVESSIDPGSEIEPDSSSQDSVTGIVIAAVLIVIVVGGCVLAGVCVMARRRKQQPLGGATRVEITDAKTGFQMDGNDKNDFKLGSGRPAEDQHGIVPGPL